MSDEQRAGPSAVAVIVDDEALARRRVVALLEGRDSIRVVAECASGSVALDAVRRYAPDLLFLDVQMPGLSGLDVLVELEADETPVVVFTTAYDEYAIRAFEVAAVDYLLKPYSDERFHEAVDRAHRVLRGERRDRAHERLCNFVETVVLREESQGSGPAESGGYLDRFAIPVHGRWMLVPSEAVDWIEAAGDLREPACGRQDVPAARHDELD